MAKKKSDSQKLAEKQKKKSKDEAAEERAGYATLLLCSGTHPSRLMGKLRIAYPKALSAELDNAVEEAVKRADEYQELQASRERGLLSMRLMHVYESAFDPRVKLRALDQYAAVNGLNAPIKVATTDVAGSDISNAMRAMRGKMSQQQIDYWADVYDSLTIEGSVSDKTSQKSNSLSCVPHSG